MFKNKNLLITGGTGSFGKAFSKFLLKSKVPLRKIIIFSRDEFKQHIFLEELKKDMLNSGAAVNIAKAKGQDITNVPDAFVKAESIVDERLSKVFGLPVAIVNGIILV